MSTKTPIYKHLWFWLLPLILTGGIFYLYWSSPSSEPSAVVDNVVNTDNEEPADSIAKARTALQAQFESDMVASLQALISDRLVTRIDENDRRVYVDTRAWANLNRNQKEEAAHIISKFFQSYHEDDIQIVYIADSRNRSHLAGLDSSGTFLLND